MANELSATISITFSKGGAEVNRAESIEITVTGDAYTAGVQEIGTTEEAVAQGSELGTPGWIFIKNIDDTNYVEFGISTGVYTTKIIAGKFAWFFVNGATLYAKANTAACNIDYIWFEL